jgi:hypothetical protein
MDERNAPTRLPVIASPIKLDLWMRAPAIEGAGRCAGAFGAATREGHLAGRDLPPTYPFMVQ